MDEPWEVDIAVLINRGIDPEKARTVTILRWMWNGNLDPLAAAILQGHVISEDVLGTFALMILDSKAYPYRIEAKRVDGRGRKGPPRKMEKFARDYIASLMYEKTTTPKKSDQTFKDIADGLIGGSRSDRTVRQAYTKYGKRKPNSA